MTRKFDENMEEFFQLEPSSPEVETIISDISFGNFEDDFSEDYIKARIELNELIEQGKNALNDILAIAKETEKGRDFEVAAGLLNNLVNANEKRLDLHRKAREITNYQSSPNAHQTINNTLFVGSTADLTKMIKSMKEKEAINVE